MFFVWETFFPLFYLHKFYNESDDEDDNDDEDDDSNNTNPA